MLLLEPLSSAAQARAADAWTIETLGVPGLVLMEHAGRAVADEVARRIVVGRSAIVVAGPGNNGGDGWVCARHLWSRGIACPVVALAHPEELRGDAAAAARSFVRTARALGWTAPHAPGGWMFLPDDEGALERLIAGAHVVVDALLGTGLSRPAAGRIAQCIDIINQRTGGADHGGRCVVAVDVPSGLPTDGEAPQGPVVHAHATVTFGGWKIAHVAEPSARWCGDVVNAGITLHHAPAAPALTHVMRGWQAPAADPLAHKGRYGHVGVVEGRPQTRGAAHLAARAALRTGAGLCTLFVDDVAARRDVEVMTRSVRGEADLHGIDALVVGPGAGDDGDARIRTGGLLHAARGHVRVVADAGALDVVRPGDAAVITPHPGEAARVLQCSVDDVQRDRAAAARSLVARTGAVVVLKGGVPVVDDGAQTVHIPGACPALAVAGSGDVLAGCIGALLARGMPPLDAAVLGSWLHQRAGASLRRRGALASEIADALVPPEHA